MSPLIGRVHCLRSPAASCNFCLDWTCIFSLPQFFLARQRCYSKCMTHSQDMREENQPGKRLARMAYSGGFLRESSDRG